MKKFICVFSVLCILFLNGCSGNTIQKNNEKTIAVSFYPVFIFTLNLVEGIDEVKVECMAEQNIGCLHDYTLTAKDAKLLSDARVLVVNGAGMEGFLEDAFRSVESISIIDSSEGIELLCGEEHAEQEAHGEHEEHSHHQSNSHIWLSVDNAKAQVENIKSGLLREFPEYENIIKRNYEDYIQRLDALAAERDSLPALTKEFSVVSFHGAYEYLGKETGFEIKTTIESDEGKEPSSKELARLSTEMKKENIRALFVAPDYNGSAAEILGRETNTEIYVINPVISGEIKLTAYEDIMKENYKTILKAVK